MTGDAKLEKLTEAWAWTWVDPGALYGGKGNVNPAKSDTKMSDLAKWTKGTGNIWTISFVPSEYMEIPKDRFKDIKQLGVLIKGNTWDDGKSKDFKFDVEPPSDIFSISLKQPVKNKQTVVLEAGSKLSISARANQAASWKLHLNNQQIYESKQASKSFAYQYTLPEGVIAGKFKLEGKNAKNEQLYQSFVFVTDKASPVAKMPEGLKQGANYGEDAAKVSLVLLAAKKKFVYAVGDFNNWTPTHEYLMNRDGERFWLEIDGLIPGKEYVYQYFIDGEIYVADPYTEKISDPFHDHEIGKETYPGLIEFPAEAQRVRSSVFQTGQTPYNWKVKNFQRPAKEDLVIYEMHIRDWVAKHDFKTVMDSLNYLETLGINALELMPVNEFEGNNSWGYNPNFFFAVDKYYGPRNDLKALVDACHERGIAVLIDMVLNHTVGSSPLVKMYPRKEDKANDAHWMWKPGADNIWYNKENPEGAYSFGPDFNHESKYTKQFVDDVNRYWLEEYKIDGFRFDFTKGFTNNPGEGTAKDDDRIRILKRMADKVWEVSPGAYVIFEHLADNAEEKILADHGIMLWGNMNGAYKNLAKGYNDDLAWQFHSKRGFNSPNLIAYMESHDEQRLMYESLKNGNNENAYSLRLLERALARTKLNAVFSFLTPGPKMIWQFGELGYDVSIFAKDKNGKLMEDGDKYKVDPKPIRWNYFEEPNRKRVYDMYSELFALKKSNPVFKEGALTYNVSSLIKEMKYSLGSHKVIIVGNFDTKKRSYALDFGTSGKWYDVFANKTLALSESKKELTLFPGEVHLYSSQPMEGFNPEALDKPAEVAKAIENVEGNTNKLKTYDLKEIFAEPDGDLMTFKLVENTNPSVVNALIGGSNLELTSGGQSGSAEIVIEAEAKRKTVQMGFSVNITQVLLEIKPVSVVSVYPVPASDGPVTLEFGNMPAKNAQATLTDLGGNEVRRFALSASKLKHSLNLTGLSCGAYLLKVDNGGSVSVHKVFIE
ncbi:MAG: alpha-amylase family glycosyl hydrolase [Cytophagales bacterium]|nr:alpha-amylase family glycosyl hydrolase [Cytophagales bacterium]